jgi:UDPglucose--hexose-1-phosphate uridylyltransferase
MVSREKSKKEAVSELRKDPVTGNWIVIAKGRAARLRGKRDGDSEEEDDIHTCPFEDPKASGNADPVLLYPSGGEAGWSLQVIPNKYPAFAGGGCPEITKVGPYAVQEGMGFHEVIITRDHTKHLAILGKEKVEEVLRAYRTRYLALKKEECVKYISLFHNHKKGAGASLSHPHSQLIAIPFLPSDIRRSLRGSGKFYQKHGECVHCAMLAWERKENKRIIFENEEFIAFCPFISRGAYEVRLLPKAHDAYFEKISDGGIQALSEILQEVLLRLYKNLENPPYNFYIHTAPVDSGEYSHYHWHFEIRPKLETGAGFELGTGVEISAVEPERAAEVLRM